MVLFRRLSDHGAVQFQASASRPRPGKKPCYGMVELYIGLGWPVRTTYFHRRMMLTSTGTTLLQRSHHNLLLPQ